jgi:hypothetical protein
MMRAPLVRDPSNRPGSRKLAFEPGEPNMKTALKILLIPVVVSGLAAFGMWATVQAGRHPSPIAKIGAPPATPFGFDSYNGEQC